MYSYGRDVHPTIDDCLFNSTMMKGRVLMDIFTRGMMFIRLPETIPHLMYHLHFVYEQNLTTLKLHHFPLFFEVDV